MFFINQKEQYCPKKTQKYKLLRTKKLIQRQLPKQYNENATKGNKTLIICSVPEMFVLDVENHYFITI